MVSRGGKNRGALGQRDQVSLQDDDLHCERHRTHDVREIAGQCDDVDVVRSAGPTSRSAAIGSASPRPPGCARADDVVSRVTNSLRTEIAATRGRFPIKLYGISRRERVACAARTPGGWTCLSWGRARIPEGGTRCTASCARLSSVSCHRDLAGDYRWRRLRGRGSYAAACRHDYVPGDRCADGDESLPASDDCPTSGARTTQFGHGQPQAPTTPISMTPLPFDRTNGDLLAITKIDGTNDLAFGGNFSLVYTPDGVSHAATNFAVVDEASGTFLYGGSPGGGTDIYVRSIGSLNGVIYVGGDFTSWAGVSRSHAVSLAPTGNPASAYAVTSWNPAPGNRVRGLAVDSSAVYLGIGSSVRAVNPTTGATIWSKGVSGGTLPASSNTRATSSSVACSTTTTGLRTLASSKSIRSDGSLVTAFDAHMRPNTGMGQYGAYDGEEVIAMAPGPNAGEVLGRCRRPRPGRPFIERGHPARRQHRRPADALLDARRLPGDRRGRKHHRRGLPQQHREREQPAVGELLRHPTREHDAAFRRRGIRESTAIKATRTAGTTGSRRCTSTRSPKRSTLDGAFVHWNGTTGLTHQSLIAFSFASANPTVPEPPTGVSASCRRHHRDRVVDRAGRTVGARSPATR